MVISTKNEKYEKFDFYIINDAGSISTFHLNDDDEYNNGNIIKPFSHNTVSVSGKLYTNGEVELTFIYNEAVTVSIKYEDIEVDCTDFIPTEGNRTLTFDLNNYGKGEYEINVSMPDGSVQTANFKY